MASSQTVRSILFVYLEISKLTPPVDPNVVRRLVKSYNLPAAPKYPKQRVLSCLAAHLELQRESSS